MLDTLEDPRVKRVVGNMCMFNMEQRDEIGYGLIKKDTGFMTNADAIPCFVGPPCPPASGQGTWPGRESIISRIRWSLQGMSQETRDSGAEC